VQRRLQSLIISSVLGLGATLAFLWFLGPDLTPVVYAATIGVTTTTDVIDANGGSCAGLTLSSLPGPDSFISLREAVCAANNTAGADDITIPVGTYSLTIPGNGEDAAATGDLDITEDLMIIGAGSANTIIEGAGAFDDRIFDIITGTVEISGTTIRNGTPPGNGGGIWNSDVLTLTDIIVTGNTAGLNGGGVFNRFGTLVVASSIISGNTATVLNGGGLANNLGTVTIDNSTIGFNSADAAGGGIWNDNILSLNSTTVVSNVVNNLITSAGGGIYNSGGSAVATLINSSVITNQAGLVGTSQGGGIFNSGTLNVDGTLIDGNLATCNTLPSTDDGSGIYNSGTATIINNSSVSNNGCVEGVYNSGSLTVDATIIDNNGFSGLDGGGIHNDVSGVASVTGSTISNNGHFDGRGAGINNDGTFTLNTTTLIGNGGNGPGGGIFNSGTGTFTANGSSIIGNNASGLFFPSGGGISSDGVLMVNTSTISGNNADSSGGGIYNTGSLIVTNSSIENNSASIGAGINNDDGSVTLSGSTLSANAAGSAAGGIQNISGIVNIANNSFIGNNTSTEGGGGIINDGGTLTVDGSTLDNNAVSGGDGGGIYNVNAGAVTLTNSTVSNNSSGLDGGGLLVISPGSTATVSNSTFSGNSADNGGGIFIAGSTSVTITQTTISSNTATLAGGGISNAGTTLIGATIVANSISGGDCSNFGSLFSLGYNLVGDTTCNTNFVGPGDTTNTNPLLGPLQNNGGNTETHAILNISSPAVDGVGPTCPPPSTDQRGVARPVGPGCDIGAYESPFISPLEAELEVVKTASPDPAILGGKITYVITATNHGPWPATNLTIVDDLPNPLTGAGDEAQVMTIDSLTVEYDPPLSESQISAGTVSCNQVGDILTCVEDSRPANTSVILTLQTTPQTTGNFVNTVQVSANEPDSIPSNNTDMTTTTVIQAVADLAISKSVTPGSVFVGESMTYTIDVNNNGPNTAFGATMIDNLPVGLIIGPVSTNLGVCNTAGGSVSCGLGTINSGGSAQITIPVTPTNFYTVPTIITNTASIAAAIATDPVPGNNIASEPVNITPVIADLQLSKDVSTGVILLGQTLVYTLEVTNLGPDPATSVVLTDPLPASLQLVSANPDQGSCSGTTTITCNLGTVNVGTIEVVLQVTPISVGTVMNTAQVTTFAVDNNIANNSATSPPTILNEPHPNLTLSKTASSGEVGVGNLLSYTLEVTNAVGADPAGNVILTDQLPAGVVFDSASAGCSEAGGIVTCNLGAIAPGGTASPVTISIRPSNIGNIINTATVTSLGTDSNPADNTDTATTSVVPLSVVIDPTTGGTLTYTDPQGNTTMINVPGGAVTTAIRLVFTPVTPSTPPPAGYTLAGAHGFTIEAFMSPSGEPVPDGFTFDPSFTVTINYSDSDVANVDNENSLILYYLNGSTWEDVATTCSPPSNYVRSPGINQIAVAICHLTEFGLFGQAATLPTYLPLILKN